MSRTIYIVDGFNLYHSVKDASRDNSGVQTKWLDIKKLCEGYLAIAGTAAGTKATLERIFYFSAFPSHCNAGTQARHTLYMRCLRDSGINVELAHFKDKKVTCKKCGNMFTAHIEKETDVAIATKLFEICHTDQADTIVMVTGDTDLAPTVRTCRLLFPAKLILFGFPYKRKNLVLDALVPTSFTIKPSMLISNQFANPLVLSTGESIPKPATW